MVTVPSLTIRGRNELKEKKEDKQYEKRKSSEKYSPQFLVTHLRLIAYFTILIRI
jgi:hypothetical protein